MSILIGMKGADRIRYISVDSPYDFTKVQYTLKNFYKSQERVQALIDLGNLEWLGINPYKKNKGDDDLVNCDSRVRDRKLSAGKHGASTVASDKEFVAELKSNSGHRINCCFLYEDGKWFVLSGAAKESIDAVDESFLRHYRLMHGLKIFTYNPDCSWDKLSSNEFRSWDEVQEAANESLKPHFIFKGERYLTTINPTLSKKELEHVVQDN